MKLWDRIRDFAKKSRTFWILGALILGLLGMSGWIYLHNVRGAADEILVKRINEDYSAVTDAIAPGSEVRQPFRTRSPIYGGSFIFTTYAANCHGTVTVELQDTAGNVLASGSMNTLELLDNTYQDIVFDHPVFPEAASDYVYVIRFSPSGEGDGRLGLWRSEGPVAGLSPMSFNGVPQKTTLGFSIVTNRVGGWIVKAYWGIAAFAIAAVALGYLLLFVWKAKLPVVFAYFAITVGFLFMLVMPPYVAPDEDTHIHSSYALSNQMLGVPSDVRIWMRGGDAVKLDRADEVDAFSYQTYADELFGQCEDRALIPTEYIAAEVFFVQYLPSALMITACRLLNFNYVTMIFFGRLANLIVYTLLMALAIHIMPRYKRILAAVGLLPMCLHLAASFNYDAMLIGVACIFFALVLYYAYEKPRLRWRDLLLLALVIVLLAPMKMLYVLLIPFCFIIPAKKCPGKVKYLVGALLVLGVVFCIIFAPYILRYIGVSRESLAAAAQKVVPKVNPLNIDYLVYDFWDLSYILTHLTGAVKLFCNAVQQNTMLYLVQLVGGELGEPILNDLMVWQPAVAGLWGVLILSVVPVRGEKLMLTRRAKAWSALVLLAVFGALLLVVYGWTPMREDILWGMQGRYWLPCLPLALLLFQNRALRLEKDATRPLLCAEAYLDVISIASVFQAILSQPAK
jgi:uncharacterized membrane protein